MDRSGWMVMILGLALTSCAGSPYRNLDEDGRAELEAARAKGLVPTHMVQPQYPRRAALAGIEGCATISFDVMPDGRTDNYLVIDSQPPGVFVKSTLLALKDWRFPKRAEPGRTTQTISYNLDGAREDPPHCKKSGQPQTVYVK